VWNYKYAGKFCGLLALSFSLDNKLEKFNVVSYTCDDMVSVQMWSLADSKLEICCSICGQDLSLMRLSMWFKVVALSRCVQLVSLRYTVLWLKHFTVHLLVYSRAVFSISFLVGL
jgi:hypothetical protein